MESKKLEKPRENGTFSTVQGVMKPDEEDRGVFPTMKPLEKNDGANTKSEGENQAVVTRNVSTNSARIDLSKVKIGGNTYQAITNVGHRPTVEKDAAKSDLLLEAHLLQYSQMAYGEEIEVSLFHYERPEVRFSGLDALKEQLKKDALACVTYFEERGNDGKKEGFIEEKA